MSDSIISNERRCVVCGTTQDLHRHHIYAGTKRKASERMGCWCYLCGKHHNLSSEGVHFNHDLDRELKMICQRIFEEKVGDREMFRSTFGKSYL